MSSLIRRLESSRLGGVDVFINKETGSASAFIANEFWEAEVNNPFIAGAFLGVAILSGILSGKGRLAGASNGVGSNAGVVRGRANISAQANGVASVSFVLHGHGKLISALTGVTTTGGILRGKGKLIAVSGGVATDSGVIRGRAAISAQTTGVASISFVIHGHGKLLSVSAGIASVSADLHQALSFGGIAATTAGAGSISAILKGRGILTGSVIIVITNTGALRGRGRLITVSGGAAAISGALHQLIISGAIYGSSAGSASLLVLIHGHGKLLSESNGIASAAAVILGKGFLENYSGVFNVEYKNPQKITITQYNRKLFSINCINTCKFEIAHVNARAMSVTHQNARIFNAFNYFPVTGLLIQRISLERLVYSYSQPIVNDILIYNPGKTASSLIVWELADNNDTVISSGNISSGNISTRTYASISISGLLAPSVTTAFKVRVRVEGNLIWTDSANASAVAEGLYISAINPWNDVYNAGQNVACGVSVVNATDVSEDVTIEWQVIRESDQSVLSSGTNNPEYLQAYSLLNINLTGITAPAAPGTIARIRARIAGEANWISAIMPLLNFIPPMPPNPEPRAGGESLIFEPPAEEMNTVITDGSESTSPDFGAWKIDPITGFWFDPIAALWMDPMGRPVDPQPAPPFPFINPPSELL